ncbi:hypothetical protein MX572_22995 (plasmid) [Rhodococcus pyridinivorans]|uniref:hypothetical protein n=1 Tax=Rhodococcus pyridinivorans TaxID=103816 RepID=UPI0020C6552B|nr:hypothetical protein [Rhodococcus pyridinivorans]UTM39667.1 hypothetical protein MX572_23050 [Rhodococcus pyridinivorans]UTM39679.1 hypothetical protein MX572_22995 [Rhodococcus pyridinivorans]
MIRPGDLGPDAYDRGFEAGLAEAMKRFRMGDADHADDGPTWFVAPVGENAGGYYERGFLAGFARFFEGPEQ